MARRRQGVWVTYNYAFSADMGGGEYERTLSQPAVYNLYLVGEQETFTRINDALRQWQSDNPTNAVIEITDSAACVEPINITLNPGQTLQLRAANGKRPVIRLLNWQTLAPDNLTITGLTDTAVDGRRFDERGRDEHQCDESRGDEHRCHDCRCFD